MRGFIFMIVFIVLSIFLILSNSIKIHNIEQFGTSPGTMVQLATSHVPTEEDLDDAIINRELVRRDIYDITGSSL